VDECDEKVAAAKAAEAKAFAAMAAERKAKIAYANATWSFGKSWGKFLAGMSIPGGGSLLTKFGRIIIGGGVNAAAGDLSEVPVDATRAEFLARRHDAEEALGEYGRRRAAALRCLKEKQTGCGSKGGPGWRKPNGQCASWRDVSSGTD